MVFEEFEGAHADLGPSFLIAVVREKGAIVLRNFLNSPWLMYAKFRVLILGMIVAGTDEPLPVLMPHLLCD